MEGFEGLWFDCEAGDQGVTSAEQVILFSNIIYSLLTLQRVTADSTNHEWTSCLLSYEPREP